MEKLLCDGPTDGKIEIMSIKQQAVLIDRNIDQSVLAGCNKYNVKKFLGYRKVLMRIFIQLKAVMK